MRKIFLVGALFYLIFPDSSLAGKLSDEALEKKSQNQGWFWQGLPLINFSSDDGIGGGLRVLRTNNGHLDDKYFDSSPYFHKITAQFFMTTKGWQYHFIEADLPYFLGSKFRLKTSFVWDESLNANYFGIGPEASNKLTARNGNKYDTFQDYEDGFLQAGDKSNYKYHNYHISRPKFIFNTYMDLTEDIKLFAGLEFKYTLIYPWGGEDFELDGDDYTSNTTRIEQEGLDDDDGWINSIKIGAGYDTRDHEVDPRDGIFVDYNAKLGYAIEAAFLRNTLGARYYITPFRKFWWGCDLTLAVRLAYTTITKEAPFHELGTFEYLLETQGALGNNRTLRGYPSNRFVGYTMSNANCEIRWQWLQAGKFEFKLLAFLDTGSAYDDPGDVFTEWDYYHSGYGGGIAIAWAQSFVLHVYYGVAFDGESSSLSIDFKHAI